MEQLISVMNLPCRNKDQGCKHVGSQSTRIAHEAICTYRPVRCPFITQCGCGFPAGKVADHLRREHKKQVTVLEKGVGSIRNQNWTMAKDVKRVQWVAHFAVGEQLLHIHTIITQSHFTQYAFALDAMGKEGDKASFMVEIATELDDGQLMKYSVRPMLQTKTRLRDGTAFIEALGKREHPEAPQCSFRRSDEDRSITEQDLHELTVTLL